ncbi:MAG: DNA gyrase subunit A [Sporichthyaceae bacterium]
MDAESGESGVLRQSHRALRRLEREFGQNAADAYVAMVELAQPWRSNLPLLEGHGNFGAPGNDPPADAEYTECRLSPAGRAAVAAERGSGPPIPFDLVNGSMFRGGVRPPYAPERVAEAVLRVARGGEAEAAAWTFDRPDFPGGATCYVARHAREGDLSRGRPSSFTFQSTIRDAGPGRSPGLEIVALPPYANPDEVCLAIVDYATKLGAAAPLHCLNDFSNEAGVRIECRACAGASLDALRAFLIAAPGVVVHLDVRLSAPAGDLLTGWIDHHGPDAAAAGAEVLRTLTSEG